MSGSLLRAVAFLLVAGAAQAASLPVEEVAPGLFVHPGREEDFSAANRGGIANLVFIVGAEAVAVVDAGGSPRQGRDWLDTVRAVTELPVRYLILTHVHPDHVLGSEAFVKAGATVVGHTALPGALARKGPSYIANMRTLLGPDFEDPSLPTIGLKVAPGAPQELDLGGRVLELRAWPTAHTETDLTVFDRSSSTLIAGDLLFVRRLPVVDGSLLGWLDVIDRLAALPAARAVPGHGPPSVTWPDGLAAERAYLVGLRDAVREVLRRGVSLAEAVAAVPPPDPGRWRLIDPNHGRNVVAAYAELEWE